MNMHSDHGPQCDEEEDNSPEVEPCCPACGSMAAKVLGTLGRRAHYRCADCGMDYSEEVS